MKHIKDNLAKHSTKEYFKIIESVIDRNENVEMLTSFFGAETHFETKPYLTRRQLVPIDTRFKTIELVYKDVNKVEAIVWYFNVSYSMLKDIFGNSIMHNEPYDNSTAFAFKSKNPNIEIILTRHTEWLTPVNDHFEYQDKDGKTIKLLDPQFSFVQISMTE